MAKANKKQPSFITVKTQIGYGCPAKQGKASAHGEPLGEDNIKALRENLGWESQEAFEVPADVYAKYAELAAQGEAAEAEWNKLFADYAAAFPEMKELWDKFQGEVDAEALLNDKDFWAYEDKAQATRALSGTMINRLKDRLPQLMGGSADLAPSNKTNMSGAGDFSAEDRAGRNLHFGVRELAMAAMANGMALHGGVLPYVATFFVFSDYMKPMMRLAALMKLPITYVLTHDSIGVGEDGPTHEPIEQLAMLRSLPNMNVFRPADATETAAAWFAAVTSKETPTSLVLTRQNLPQLAGSDAAKTLQGAYVISEAEKAQPDAIIIASGSEVGLAVGAQAELLKEGVAVRVVSAPCLDVFAKQSAEYQESVLPKAVRARVAVEAASDFGWGKYIGLDGATVTMQSFGASAPAKVLMQKFGFTVENVVAAVKSVLA